MSCFEQGIILRRQRLIPITEYKSIQQEIENILIGFYEMDRHNGDAAIYIRRFVTTTGMLLMRKQFKVDMMRWKVDSS